MDVHVFLSKKSPSCWNLPKLVISPTITNEAYSELSENGLPALGLHALEGHVGVLRIVQIGQALRPLHSVGHVEFLVVELDEGSCDVLVVHVESHRLQFTTILLNSEKSTKNTENVKNRKTFKIGSGMHEQMGGAN